ncbi:hypothetical protein M513_13977, partial [Trichuris suis]
MIDALKVVKQQEKHERRIKATYQRNPIKISACKRSAIITEMLTGFLLIVSALLSNAEVSGTRVISDL